MSTTNGTSPTTQMPSGLEIRLTMAPALYGSNVSWMFLGFILMQTFTYYHNSLRDRIPFKAFVYAVVLIAITATGLECFVGYRYLVGGWGDPSGQVVEVPPKEFLFQPLCDAVLGTMVQCFFAWRIWTFGIIAEPKLRHLTRITSAFIVVLSFLALACSIAFPILFFKVDSQPALWSTTRPVVITWTVSSAVIDIIISASMIAILRHARSRTNLPGTRDTISRLIRLTVQTGSLTSILALAIIIVFLKEPFGNMHTFPAYLLGKSYAMSLLANVNARTNTAPGSAGDSGFTSQGTLAFSPPAHRRKAAKPGISISSTVSDPGLSSGDYTSGVMNSGKDFRHVKFGMSSTDSEAGSKRNIPYEVQGEELQLQNVAQRDRSLRCLSDLVV